MGKQREIDRVVQLPPPGEGAGGIPEGLGIAVDFHAQRKHGKQVHRDAQRRENNARAPDPPAFKERGSPPQPPQPDRRRDRKQQRREIGRVREVAEGAEEDPGVHQQHQQREHQPGADLGEAFHR